MSNNITKEMGAKITKFVDMSERITRGRNPEQVKELFGNNNIPLDILSSKMGIPPVGIMSKAGSFLEKYFTPQDQQVAINLLTSKVNDKTLRNSLERLSEMKEDEYFKGLKFMIEQVKRGATYETTDNYNPLSK
jgi:hypothetical protein